MTYVVKVYNDTYTSTREYAVVAKCETEAEHTVLESLGFNPLDPPSSVNVVWVKTFEQYVSYSSYPVAILR